MYQALFSPHTHKPGNEAKDGHPTIVYLYLSCVGAKNIVESLLRDISQCCKEALAIKNTVDGQDVL